MSTSVLRDPARRERKFKVAEENFQTVARVDEVPEGEGRVFEVGNRLIAVFRDQGQFYAIDDACPHQGAPLSDGIVYDKSVTCTWHGWRFSLENGRHLEGSKCRVAVYPVRVEGEQIQVSVPA
jgi:nitrite reductase (NADH) small subunit/3-phenylpropionate/trans-cinnamate dioxygenase ferredoxin subunit